MEKVVDSPDTILRWHQPEDREAMTPRQYGKTLVVLLMVGLWALLPSWARAQTPAPEGTNQQLDSRVKELEEIVKRMEAERANGKAKPSPAPVILPIEPSESPASPATGGAEPIRMPAAKTPVEVSPSFVDESMKKSESKPLAGWDKGFYLRSEDDRFHLRITGQIQADYRSFLDYQDLTDIDNFFLRRARLGIEAEMFQYYEFRFLPDFGQGRAVSLQPTIPIPAITELSG